MMARSWRLSDRDFSPTNIYPRKTMSTYLEKAEALPAGPNAFSRKFSDQVEGVTHLIKPVFFGCTLLAVLLSVIIIT